MELTPTRPEAPAVGTGLALQPHGVAGVVDIAELVEWSDGPAGLVATARVVTTPQAARGLHGVSLWATGRTAESDALVVFEAVASLVGSDELLLTGVRRLAREHRRAVVRAALCRPVRVTVGGAPPYRTHTVDLSRGGCRVVLPESASLPLGEVVSVVLDLDEATTVRTQGRVLRIERSRGNAVVRFLGLSPADAGRLDRAVYAELSRDTSQQS